MHPGVVHRDLKPENILLSDKSANAHILIAGTAPNLYPKPSLTAQPGYNPGGPSPTLTF